MADKVRGVLEVGRVENEVVINHPDLEPDENGVGHIVFSANQARGLALSLLKFASQIQPDSDEFYIDFNTRQQPGKIQAVRVRLELVTIEDMQQRMNIALCQHPLYLELKKYVEANQ